MSLLLTGAGRGGGGGLSPSSLVGVVGWWDSSNFASLTLSGSNVLSVADVSGGGNTMNNVNANKPQYGATAFNTSHPGILFFASSFTALECASFPMGPGIL